MNISQAMPLEAVDLTNCDREPIHLLGGIQNFGFLIAVSNDWLVERVSANVGAFLGRDAQGLLGEPITAILPEKSIHAIRGRLQLLASSEDTERLFGLDLLGDGARFDVAVHLSGTSMVIEAEPSDEHPAVSAATLVKSMVARVQRTEGLERLFRESVRQLRAVTGFDRVMLYRFAESGAGSVVAESATGAIGTFLGLNYPAADIPAQARALYIRNHIRIIADVNAEPVPIVPALDTEGRPIDLSLSVLRSVSPIHIEYLRNMGVGASMSVSIVIDGQLWGLFALHHYSARYLPMELRSAIETFGQMISFVIEGRLFQEQRQAEAAARDLHDRFVARMAAARPSIESISDFAEELRELVPSDGFAVVNKGEARCFGTCPPEEDLAVLVRFLNEASAGQIYATDDLSSVHPPAAGYRAEVAGLLAIPISRVPRDYILFFRGEIARTVTWAGDPTGKEQVPGPNGPRLTPRKSFEAWKETVHGCSLPWTETQKTAAESLRISIMEVLLRFTEESERQQALANQRQELLIAELNHRVRNVLSLIRALVTQSKPGAGDVDEFARIIGGRIQALARAQDQLTSHNADSFRLEDILRTEVSAYIGSKSARVHLDGPPVFVEPQALSTLALVFHELVTNSAKYGALSDSSGLVEVDWVIDEEDVCRLSWRESGGPPVRAPERRGFGTTIIERSIPHDLGGKAHIDYRLTGVHANFVLPKTVTRRSPAASERSGGGKKAASVGNMLEMNTSLRGLRALIVEDNMIISLDAEQLMLDNGMQEIFTAASVAEARKIIVSRELDVALLDVNLGAETSFALVDDLKTKGVPFVFVTGYGEQIVLPENARGAVAIKKPFAREQLVAALAKAASERVAPV